MLKLPEIVKLFTCLFLYDNIYDNKHADYKLSLVSEQHNYETRSTKSELLTNPSFRLNIRKFCPTVQGKYFWNDIPLEIRHSKTKTQFKQSLKKSLSN